MWHLVGVHCTGGVSFQWENRYWQLHKNSESSKNFIFVSVLVAASAAVAVVVLDVAAAKTLISTTAATEWKFENDFFPSFFCLNLMWNWMWNSSQLVLLLNFHFLWKKIIYKIKNFSRIFLIMIY